MEDDSGNISAPLPQGEDQYERRLTGDGSSTLFSSHFGQTFHSHHGAVAESKHVFLEGSDIGARLRRGDPVRILEVGFGTGLNFLLTAQEAHGWAAPLEYVALERRLLPAELLESLDYAGYAPAVFAALLRFRLQLGAEPPEGEHRGRLAGSTLELRLGEAAAARIEVAAFDAVYHDAFSPDANPELWEESFLGRLTASLVPGGTLVSYTVKGEVRRRLSATGLEVRKAPGPPGGKREMLLARKVQQG